MPDENGKPLPGEPGHYRYEKDKILNAKESKATTMETLDKTKKVDETDKAIDSNKVFSKTAVKDMKRTDQEDILKNRKVEFTSKDKEEDLIKKILKSNPK